MLLFRVSEGAEKRGRVAEGVISERAAAALCFIRVRGVARCNGQQPRQPSSKVNSTASLSSPGLCLFCPLQSPPEKCWHPALMLCSRLTDRLAGSLCECWLCCCPATFLLQQSCFQQKSHRCACSFPMHAAAGSCGAETWKIASRDLAFLFQAPSSFREIRCVLCVRKN